MWSGHDFHGVYCYLASQVSKHDFHGVCCYLASQVSKQAAFLCLAVPGPSPSHVLSFQFRLYGYRLGDQGLVSGVCALWMEQ